MAFCKRHGMPCQLVGAKQLRSQRLLIAVLAQEGITVEARLETV
jgi:hypothetical protein